MSYMRKVKIKCRFQCTRKVNQVMAWIDILIKERTNDKKINIYRKLKSKRKCEKERWRKAREREWYSKKKTFKYSEIFADIIKIRVNIDDGSKEGQHWKRRGKKEPSAIKISYFIIKIEWLMSSVCFHIIEINIFQKSVRQT